VKKKMVEFTEEERKFIEDSFEMTRRFFPDDPLNKRIGDDNINDIMLAVNYRHDHIGGLGTRGHKIMWGIFNKLGFCKDGKTTFEEREQQIKEAKEAEIRQRKKAQKERIEELNRFIKEAQEKLERVQKTDEEIEAEITQKELEAKRELQEQMSALRVQKQRKAERNQNQYVAILRGEIEELREEIDEAEEVMEKKEEPEPEIEEESIEPKEEAEPEPEPEIKEEKKEKPEPREEEIKEEKVEVEPEVREEPDRINPFKNISHGQIKQDYTVDQLKAIADEFDIRYDQYILKDDLIQKIKER